MCSPLSTRFPEHLACNFSTSRLQSSVRPYVQPFVPTAMCTFRFAGKWNTRHVDVSLRTNSSSCRRAVALPWLKPTTLNTTSPTYKPKLRYRGITTGAITLDGEGVSVIKPALIAEAVGAAKLPVPIITRADEDFEKDGIQFVWGTTDLCIDELNDLFQRVGFPRRDPGRLAAALVNTHRLIWVRAARKSRMAKEGQLLGFARATSDGSLSATIWDVAVTPAWQKGGLGRAMVERLTASLVTEGITIITLYAEPGVVGLYEKLGFVKDPEGVKGLAFQSNSKQAKTALAAR